MKKTTMLFENVKPINKKMFSLTPTDVQGTPITLTQQILNNRFEILRQFIKQTLHSLIYCHNNGIIHNNVLSRATFAIDEQFKIKLMGFEHAVQSNDPNLRYRDMKHLAVIFAELMFATQFDVSGDDVLADWSSIWCSIQSEIDRHQDIVEMCPHATVNDKLLYIVNSKTKNHMFDLLKQMFHTSNDNYYHDYMYHSFVGMASSLYKEKSKQKLREKTIHMLNGSRNVVATIRPVPVDKASLIEKWNSKREVM